MRTFGSLPHLLGDHDLNLRTGKSFIAENKIDIARVTLTFWRVRIPLLQSDILMHSVCVVELYVTVNYTIFVQKHSVAQYGKFVSPATLN